MPTRQYSLNDTVSRYIQSWRRMSRLYAAISVLLRLSLIILTAVIAAKLTFKPQMTDHYELFFGILGVLSAVGTAVEGWLKPREKWRGFMADCEDAEFLQRRLLAVAEDDSAHQEQVQKLCDEFNGLLARHREKNVF